MKDKLIEMRINFLKQMQEYIFNTEDDDLWDDWNDKIVEPIYEDLFKIIANNDDYWKNACEVFNENTIHWKNANKTFNELTKLAKNERKDNI